MCAGAETPRPRRPLRFIAPVAAVAVVLAIPVVFGGRFAAVPAIAVGVTLLAAGTVVGVIVRARRQRRAYEARLTAWAGDRAAQAERLRLARELHDLVSQNLGLVTVRAASALHLADRAGDRAALADIERIGREAMTELRRMLHVLRQPGTPAPAAPPETFAALPAIVGNAEAAGLDVELELAGVADAGGGLQLAICGIVREGLANAARHAGPTRVTVRIYRDDDHVVVTIRDAGPRHPDWSPVPGAQQGLATLAERVAVLGGRLTSHRGADGFELSASLPDRRES